MELLVGTSLGQQRFVLIAGYDGENIAREAKAIVPSASAWLNGRVRHRQSYYQKAITDSIAWSVSTYRDIAGTWLIRRLSPDSNSIEIDELPKESDTEVLLSAMGLDTANVPLGLKNSQTILSHLHKMKPNWLRSSAKDMASIVEHEWKEYKAS